MKKIALLLIVCTAPFFPLSAGERGELSTIREYYSETLKKIKAGSLYQRELNLTYPVIPRIGTTSSRVRIYYDIPEGRDSQYEYSIIRLENYYQRGSKAFYEEYLFNPGGELLFYYGRRGTGNIGRPDGIRWDYQEQFYFWKENLIRIMHGQEPQERFGPTDIKKGSDRLVRAQEIREEYCQMQFPVPLVFITD